MQTIGERLEEARKKKGISIREAAEATKIRGDYLQKFESNQFDIGLTEIYTRGFLRTYANYLKVPADRLLSDYAALGRGDARPRQPSREVYGRMDITVATAESGETPSPTPAPEAAPEPSHANRGPQRPKTGSSLPSGPDPAVVFKYVKIGGVVVIAILLLWILKSLFSTNRSVTPASPPSGVSTAARGSVLTFTATNPVYVKVTRRKEDNEEGEILLQGMLTQGESRTLQKTGPIFIEANRAENLNVEIDGRVTNLGKQLGAGPRRGQVE